MNLYWSLCLFLTFLIIPCGFITSSNEVDTLDKVICIDPGHGGFDSGTTESNYLEKDINLTASLYLGSILESFDRKVIYTRTTDIALAHNKKEDMKKRLDIINQDNVCLYLSIHTNAYPSSNVFGAQAFYAKENKESKEFADKLQKMLTAYDKENQRTAKSLTGKYIVDNAQPVGIILELGFLTSEKDRKYLLNEDNLKILMTYVAVGISDYLSI